MCRRTQRTTASSELSQGVRCRLSREQDGGFMEKPVFALGLILGLAATSGAAVAADLPTQPIEPPPVFSEQPSSIDLHGFSDTSLKNDYITPRGLLVTNRGATIQSVDLLILDVFKNPTGTISDVSFVGGTFVDINPGFQAPNTDAFNEIDYIGGVSVKIGKNWTLSAQYIQFDSPQSAFFVERNAEFGVKYDDSGWNPVLPLNPYAKLFYTFKGQSSAVVTGHTATFDVEVGAVPAYDLALRGVPVVLTAPTWVTVGPSEFWGGASNFGVFSTGLVATVPLPGIPSVGSVLPHASVHFGVQYYRILNDRLLLAQTLVGTGVYSTHSNVVVPSLGVTVSF